MCIVSDEELDAQGLRNWNAVIEGFRIINGGDLCSNFTQASADVYQMDVTYQGQAYTIAISNNGNVWGDIFSVILSENWGADEALVAITAIGELPALGIARVGPALCIRHSVSLPSASIHAFTNGALMTAIGTDRIIEALRAHYELLQGPA